MAVAIDNVGGVAHTPTEAGGSTSFIVGTGSERLLFVGIPGWDSQAGDTVPTSITYNGVSMTQLTGGDVIDAGDNRVTLWGLVNPASGSNTLAWTFTGAVEEAAVCIISVTGALQTGVTSGSFGTVATANGTATPATVNVSAATGDLVVDAVYAAMTGVGSVGAGQTQAANVNPAGDVKGLASYEAGAATVTMSWALAGSVFGWITAGVAIKASGSSAVTLTPGLGSTPMTGRTPGLGFTIGMPDQP